MHRMLDTRLVKSCIYLWSVLVPRCLRGTKQPRRFVSKRHLKETDGNAQPADGRTNKPDVRSYFDSSDDSHTVCEETAGNSCAGGQKE